jgi:thiosulfate dehydrogenase
MYGRTVNGAVLGDPAFTPPAGTVPAGELRDKYDKQSQE